ncbi:hypothetical protein P170DRAFT_438191 [Aspergillus steynii IBT 23096]|uniref:Uncharacterized protein n=1 Tax=Aspergillus steynii IBT 23096 TaxID=1392250 RepID=A0A2I2G0H5_9EURO|nr:uncharacterized protein P170DRAFT_438191 [Aspergillus steynii IBT 23096]PLB46381.1 hypothetical protein P170DRAFT_438191 [Aspergillus steynii IBT 23096]
MSMIPSLSKPLSTTLLRSLRPATVLQPRLRPYHPEPISTKGEDFYVAATFPDDYESPTLIIKKAGGAPPSWDELHATLSEASVKADRGDVEFRPLERRDEIERILWPDREEPKIDEL